VLSDWGNMVYIGEPSTQGAKKEVSQSVAQSVCLLLLHLHLFFIFIISFFFFFFFSAVSKKS